MHMVTDRTNESGVVVGTVAVTVAIDPRTTITTTTILFYGEGEAGVDPITEPLTTNEVKVVTVIRANTSCSDRKIIGYDRGTFCFFTRFTRVNEKI